MDKRELPVAAPCTVDWRKMTPADGGRFCGDCKKVVRDLSTMTQQEARALLSQAGAGQLCVRFLHDRHGKVFFADQARPLLPASLLSRAKRVALAAAAVAVPLALQGCSDPPGAEAPEDLEQTMGAMAYDPGMAPDAGEELARDDAGDSGKPTGDSAPAGDAAASNDAGTKTDATSKF